jgi:hypothetical protein
MKMNLKERMLKIEALEETVTLPFNVWRLYGRPSMVGCHLQFGENDCATLEEHQESIGYLAKQLGVDKIILGDHSPEYGDQILNSISPSTIITRTAGNDLKRMHSFADNAPLDEKIEQFLDFISTELAPACSYQTISPDLKQRIVNFVKNELNALTDTQG